MDDDVLEVPQGRFTLRRHPVPPDPSLRGHDAADAYALRWLAGEEAVGVPPFPTGGAPDGRWLVVDHLAGAAAVALHAHRSVLWSDSSLCHEGARRNLAANDLPEDAVEPLRSTHDPADVARVAVAVVKVPRSLEELDDLLRRLRPALVPGAVVVGAGLTRHVHTSTVEAFATIVGPTVTSHAVRRARLLHATLDPDLDVAPAAVPRPRPLDVAGTTVQQVARPGVFAGGALDGGTALLLGSVDWSVHAGAGHVVDLGCGSGLLGTVAAAHLPEAAVTFVDESYAAVASARATFVATHPRRSCTGLVDDAGRGLAPAGADLVLCNPPFHAQGARRDDVALRMFTAARRALRPGGTLVVVGNRHLGHHRALSERFDVVRVVGSDPRFVVTRATVAR
ncbi:MAG: class I SAM-dependent methyltransferase [Actinomycetes bacterium]